MFVFFFVKYFPRFRSFTEKITRTFQTIKLICFYKIRTSVYRHCFITIWNLNRFLLPLAIQSTSQKKNSILDQPQQTKKKFYIASSCTVRSFEMSFRSRQTIKWFTTSEQKKTKKQTNWIKFHLNITPGVTTGNELHCVVDKAVTPPLPPPLINLPLH